MRRTFLISHTNSKGTGIAVKNINARSEAVAKEVFRKRYPEREISTVTDQERARG